MLKKFGHVATHNTTWKGYALVTALIAATVALPDHETFSDYESYFNYFRIAGGAFILAGMSATGSFTLCDAIRRRRWLRRGMSPVIFTFVDHDWKFRRDGDFSARCVFTLRNVGKEPLDQIPSDGGIFFQEPRQPHVHVKSVDAPGKHFTIHEYTYSVHEKIVRILTGRKAYHMSWSHSVHPPIEPGDQLTYLVEIETLKSEAAAFTQEGSILGVPANIPIEKAKLRCAAPDGYKFVILRPVMIVDSETWENDPDAESRISQPVVSAAGRFLDWDLQNLEHGRRYWVKYRFEPEGDSDVAAATRV